MTSLKNINWHGGASGHSHQRPRSQRDLVAASLIRTGSGSPVRWDERVRTTYATR
jgi:hypothetical protein